MRSLVRNIAALACILPTTALAADWGYSSFSQPYDIGMSEGSQYSIDTETLRLRAGVGVLLLQGDEFVFNGDRTLSHLIWQSAAPVMRGSIDLQFGQGFSIMAGGSIAGSGISYMEDYDWMLPTNSFDNWTDRSQHPDTRLDHFLSGEVALGYDLVRLQDANVRLHGGVKYTDVAWSSYGGSYVYSVNGFRNQSGNFVDGEPAIAYRQRLPEVFVGVDGEERYGNVRVGGLLRGGLTVLGSSTDNHWMRDLRVEDNFNVAPSVTLGVDAGLALGRMAELFIAARYDQHFQMRGRADYINTNTGVTYLSGSDIAGAALKSVDLTVGLKGRF